MSLQKRLISILTVFLSLAAWSEASAQPANDALQREVDIDFASDIERYTREGRLDDALSLLDSRPDLAARPDVIRLRAALLHQLGRSDEALSLLEAHLTRAPDDALARFHLAEIHLDARRYRAAQLAYRMALAGNLDALRRQVAKARLAQIGARYGWRYWAGASVAPDSNLNSATDAQRVDLFGLPFDLNDDARRQGGITLSAFGGLERSFSYAEGQAIRIGLVGSLSDAPGRQFDSASASFRAGPEWLIGRDGEISVQATAGQRWYGGDLLETRGGMIASAAFGQRTRWSGAIYSDSIDDMINDGRDGWWAGVDAARTYYLSPSSLWRLGVSITHREAAVSPESYTQARLIAGLLLPLPFATMAYLEPYVLDRHHEAAAVAFGVVREDVETGVAVRFSKRDWSLLGAFPYVAASISDSESTIEIGDFSRERIEFGLTREF